MRRTKFLSENASLATKQLARSVLIHGPISRAKLAQRLGLSAASLTRLGAPLLDSGFFVEGELLLDGGVGRPTRLLDVQAGAGSAIGLKITDQSVHGVLTDLRVSISRSETIPLPDTKLETVLDAVCELVERLDPRDERTGLGICLGGLVHEREVVRAPFLGWRSVPLADLLEKRLSGSVQVENDVQSLTIAQQWFGAGREVDDFAVVTVGAGVGSSLVLNDTLVTGPDSGLGLVGHFPLDPTGPLCEMGHRGCTSVLLTNRAMTQQFAAATGQEIGYPELLGLADGGVEPAATIVHQAGQGLGTLISAVANISAVNTVVLAGEGVGLIEVLGESLKQRISELRDPEAQEVRLSVAQADFSQWAQGAAAVAIEKSILGG